MLPTNSDLKINMKSFIGKSTISMGHGFYSFVKLPDGKFGDGLPWLYQHESLIVIKCGWQIPSQLGGFVRENPRTR
jgi:hypothetical protein